MPTALSHSPTTTIHLVPEAPPELDPDLELLRRWSEGDKQAGNRLLRRYITLITQHFRHKIGDTDALDLTQETFKRLVESVGRFEERSTFRGFLFGIARNVLNTYLRKRYRGHFDPELHSLSEVDDLTPSRVLSYAVRYKSLIACIRELPVDTQQLLELYFWYDMTATQLGQVLDIPESTVRTRVHSARQRVFEGWRKLEPSGSELELERQLQEIGSFLRTGPTLGKSDEREDPR